MANSKSKLDRPSARDGELTTQEVCDYISDMLDSIEDIAAHHELTVLACLIRTAKEEAKAYR